MARGSALRDFPPAPPKRGRSRPWHWSWCRQPHHEAHASNPRFAVGAERPRAVLRPDAPAMRLDDLFRDRQPQPGILPKPLMRPVGVKTLEDSFQRILADPRPIVVDDDFNFRLRPAAD